MKITPRRGTRPATTQQCAPWCQFHDTETNTNTPGGICVGTPTEFDGGSVNLIRAEHGTQVSIQFNTDQDFSLADATHIGHLLVQTAAAGMNRGQR
jgi:hypothetical protein